MDPTFASIFGDETQNGGDDCNRGRCDGETLVCRYVVRNWAVPTEMKSSKHSLGRMSRMALHKCYQMSRCLSFCFHEVVELIEIKLDFDSEESSQPVQKFCSGLFENFTSLKKI